MYPASHPARRIALAATIVASARTRIAAERLKVSVRSVPRRLGRGRVLQLEQSVIKAAAGEQLRMRAALAQRPLAQHQDTVGALDGGQAMRDYQRGAILEQFVERALDQRL